MKFKIDAGEGISNPNYFFYQSVLYTLKILWIRKTKGI